MLKATVSGPLRVLGQAKGGRRGQLAEIAYKGRADEHPATNQGNTVRKKGGCRKQACNGKKGSIICIALYFGSTHPLSILHQETLDNANVKVEDASRLQSTNENLLK